MKRACGCRADPLVFGHTECGLGPRWLTMRIVEGEDGGLKVIRRRRR